MRLRPILLIVMSLLWLSSAQAEITFGVVPNSASSFPSAAQARQFASHLEKRLGDEVTVRSLPDAAELHAWLNRFRTVDIAVVTVDYARRQPAGEFYPLAAIIPEGGASQPVELIVARKSIPDSLRIQLEKVLTTMGSDPEGHRLLADLRISNLRGSAMVKPLKTKPSSARATGSVASFPIPAAVQSGVAILAAGVPRTAPDEAVVAAPSEPTPVVVAPPRPLEPSMPPALVVAPSAAMSARKIAPTVPKPSVTAQSSTTGRVRVEILAEGVPRTAPDEAVVSAPPPSPVAPVVPPEIPTESPVATPAPEAVPSKPLVADQKPPETPAVTPSPAPAPPVTSALADLGAPTPVSLEADQLEYDQAASAYRASGDVNLQKGSTTLVADQMFFNDATSDTKAMGNVHLVDPSGDLRAEQFDYNLETGLGLITSGTVFMKDRNFYLTGAEIEKTGEQSYRLRDGTFTTCDGEVPSWKFGASRIDVTMGRYAHARNVLFYLHDLPVLYIPYVAFPVKNERESGLLMPRFGYSDKRGVELSLAYYQVIDRNQDATFYVDYLSDFGVGEGLEYRYLFGEDNEGVFKGYYVNNVQDRYLREKLKEDPELEETLDESDRYALEWTHWGTLPADWRLSADVEYVSNRDYFDEFGVVAEDYTKDQTESVVLLSRTWQNYILAGELDYTQNLEVDDDATLQRLPEIRFDALRQRVGDTPFYYSLGSSYTYFWREEEDESEGLANGHRLSIRPALSAFFTPLDWLEIVPEIGYRERLYQTSSAGPGNEQEGIYDFSTRVGSSFYRIYDAELGSFKKIRHSFDPEIIYSYIPDEDQDHLPYFDYLDRIDAQSRVTYALTNRFTARLEPEEGKAEYLEFLYLRLSQSYDIQEFQYDEETLSDEDSFSDIRAELIFSPIRSTFLKLDTYYDMSDRALDRFNARAGVKDQDGNAISFNYRYVRENTEYSTDGIEYASGNLDLAWLEPVYLGYSQRYDLMDELTLEQVFDVEYRAQCWSVFLTLRDRLEDREYLLTFALSGIGNILKLGGSLGTQNTETE